MKVKKTEIAWSIAIVVFSIMLFLTYTYSNINAAYADDNIMQWGPIIRVAFDRIFSGSGIPFYNFFDYKGIDIFSSGYYGLLNPFMYIAYIISRFIFSFNIDILTIYIILMFCLGNLIMNKLLAELGVSCIIRAVAIFSYSTSLIFFEYLFYYFTFNNYLFVPLFLLIILKTRKCSFEWFIPGLSIAFSLLMGHVQYTSYYLLLYAVIQVVLAVGNRSFKPIFTLMANTAIFFVLSSPVLYCSIISSRSRDLIIPGSRDFFASNIEIKALFNPFNSLMFEKNTIVRSKYQKNLGLGINAYVCLLYMISPFMKFTDKAYKYLFILRLEKVGENEKKKLKNHTLRLSLAVLYSVILLCCSVMDLHSYIFLGVFCVTTIAMIVTYRTLVSEDNQNSNERIDRRFLLWVGIGAILSLMSFGSSIFLSMAVYYIYICCFQHKCPESNDRVVNAFLFAGAFFVLFGAGESEIVAYFLGIIPVFNKFRFLYKCAFIYVPILIICAVYKISRLKLNPSRNRMILASYLVCSVISAFAIIYLNNSGLHRYINNTKDFNYFDYSEDGELIEKNIEELSLDRDYRFLTILEDIEDVDIIERASGICVQTFAKNYNSMFSVFTIGGYDNIFSEESFIQSNMIMRNLYSEYAMSNVCIGDMLYGYAFGDNNNLEKFENQIIKNSVKYLLVEDTESGLVKKIEELIEKCSNLRIAKITEWGWGFLLFELDNVNSICYTEDIEKIDVSSKIDEIEFISDFDEDKRITLSLTYDEHLILTLEDNHGNVKNVSAGCTQDGYLYYDIPQGNYSGRIIYKNTMMSISVIFAIFIVSSFALFIFLLLKKPNNMWNDGEYIAQTTN